jgi:antitoxin MazE
MRLRISKWGNSLALRIPADVLRQAGLQEGDDVEAELTPSGGIRIHGRRPFDKHAFLERAARLRANLQKTSNTVQRMREQERY